MAVNPTKTATTAKTAVKAAADVGPPLHALLSSQKAREMFEKIIEGMPFSGRTVKAEGQKFNELIGQYNALLLKLPDCDVQELVSFLNSLTEGEQTTFISRVLKMDSAKAKSKTKALEVLKKISAIGRKSLHRDSKYKNEERHKYCSGLMLIDKTFPEKMNMRRKELWEKEIKPRYEKVKNRCKWFLGIATVMAMAAFVLDVWLDNDSLTAAIALIMGGGLIFLAWQPQHFGYAASLGLVWGAGLIGPQIETSIQDFLWTLVDIVKRILLYEFAFVLSLLVFPIREHPYHLPPILLALTVLLMLGSRFNLVDWVIWILAVIVLFTHIIDMGSPGFKDEPWDRVKGTYEKYRPFKEEPKAEEETNRASPPKVQDRPKAWVETWTDNAEKTVYLVRFDKKEHPTFEFVLTDRDKCVALEQRGARVSIEVEDVVHDRTFTITKWKMKACNTEVEESVTPGRTILKPASYPPGHEILLTITR